MIAILVISAYSLISYFIRPGEYDDFSKAWREIKNEIIENFAFNVCNFVG